MSLPITFACAVCFGDPSSLNSKALWIAVMILFGVVLAVLASIAWTGLAWARRDKKMNPEAYSG